ncbi:CDP-glycerol glycerophosphotransferase family protein [Clostridium sp. AWRP]|uniref:CDP-glycerol glycerophosphotransferase family protein n=1 Tax=Clostridium sp. AWRP TaxID=2212991 RepID=UPI000FDC790D|nr:CDP-glycerol glycerophosphotransferase family protein [Clostridium sp. AWRP]AZV55527.1 hypothetical protein DMR38_02300 [Clostridium sp. AWRP]
MKRYMGVKKRLLSIANKIIPKSNIVLFSSYPAFSDNSLALFHYIVNNRKDIIECYRLYWGQSNNDKVPEIVKENVDVTVVEKGSFKGIWTFLRAKYIFSTHGYFSEVYSGAGQSQVNLWHGNGYKSITDKDRMYRGDLTIVTGDIYRKIHSRVLDMDENRVITTGLPRNDWLFSKEKALEKLGVSKESYKKIYIWMPTYRKASIGHSGVDGNATAFGISTMNAEQFRKLEDVLLNNNCLLIIKPHPMDSMLLAGLGKYEHIRVITNIDLENNDIQLYELLPETDGLLSDYSSVVVDYLLLGKPITMVLSDMDEYRKSRGFVFDLVEDYFPGPIVSDFDSLLNYFQEADTIDNQWLSKRLKLKKVFHKYDDACSSERVCNLIFDANCLK